jgi:hypothetical protein
MSMEYLSDATFDQPRDLDMIRYCLYSIYCLFICSKVCSLYFSKTKVLGDEATHSDSGALSEHGASNQMRH